MLRRIILVYTLSVACIQCFTAGAIYTYMRRDMDLYLLNWYEQCLPDRAVWMKNPYYWTIEVDIMYSPSVLGILLIVYCVNCCSGTRSDLQPFYLTMLMVTDLGIGIFAMVIQIRNPSKSFQVYDPRIDKYIDMVIPNYAVNFATLTIAVKLGRVLLGVCYMLYDRHCQHRYDLLEPMLQPPPPQYEMEVKTDIELPSIELSPA